MSKLLYIRQAVKKSEIMMKCQSVSNIDKVSKSSPEKSKLTSCHNYYQSDIMSKVVSIRYNVIITANSI